MRNHVLSVLGCIALGCGAPSDEVRPLYLVDGEMVFGEQGIELETAPASELGQSSQALMFAPAGASNPGIKPDTYQTCTQGDSNQNCVIPHQKAIIWHIYDGTSAQRTAVRAQIAEWRLDMVAQGMQECSHASCWQIREGDGLDDPELTVVISLSQSASGSCPGQSDQTRSLFCWGGQTTGVPKHNASALWGTYHRFADHIVPVVTIDYVQIQSLPGLTAGQKTNRLRQVTRAVLLGAGGKGLAVIGANRCNNTYLLDPSASCAASASEACFFNGFGDVGNDLLWIGGANCGN